MNRLNDCDHSRFILHPMRPLTTFFLVVLLLVAPLSVKTAFAQALASPDPQNPPQTAPQSAASSSSTKKHQKSLPPFLIIGTVFNENGLSFPGVHVRVRVNKETKFRWETTTNSRGEFAVRVPDGIQYEVVVHQKKYRDQSITVAAIREDVQKRLTIKLESIEVGKVEGKK